MKGNVSREQHEKEVKLFIDFFENYWFYLFLLTTKRCIILFKILVFPHVGKLKK